MTRRRISPDRLRRAMELAGLNPIELAALCAISPVYMRQILTGRRTLANNPLLRNRLARHVRVAEHLITEPIERTQSDEPAA